MKNIFKTLSVSVAVIFIVVGCRMAPVMNIDSKPIEISAKHSSKDVKKAIIRAGGSLGWNMKVKSEGYITGTLHLRDHVAVVDITYDAKKYSIKYKDSQNLNYDGTNIHTNYNGWVKNLDRNIQVQLSIL